MVADWPSAFVMTSCFFSAAKDLRVPSSVTFFQQAACAPSVSAAIARSGRIFSMVFLFWLLSATARCRHGRRRHTMTLRRIHAAFCTILLLLVAAVAWSHPIPDIPVRTFFPGDGTARITVEVDPRCFEDEPYAAPSLLAPILPTLSEERKATLQRQAAELVRRCIEFTIEPVGRIQPDFTFRFAGRSGAPLAGAEDVVVLTGEWSTTLASGLTGWHIRSTKESTLSVIFQNIIRGEVHPRIAVLFPGEQSFTLDLTDLRASQAGAATAGSVSATGSAKDSWSTFIAYLRQGFNHVVPEGLDHILFVLGIFLLSREWKPLLAQVTTFTFAHSVTLALATLGLVHVSAAVVEPIIVASIAAVAIENIFRPRCTRWRLLVVFVFGLIHGLGFAGALRDLDLPTGSLVSGLVGFNIGVECGQLVVITTAFLATLWLQDAARYRRWIVVPGSILIAGIGVWWTILRVVHRA